MSLLPTYILDENKVAVREPDPLRWSEWMAEHEMERVDAVTGNDSIRISTVFLGLDHDHWGRGPPLLFETMVFGGEHDEFQWRCSTWEEAEATHRTTVAVVFPALVRS